MIELTLTAKDLLAIAPIGVKSEPHRDRSGREYSTGDVVIRPTVWGKSAFLCLVRVTKITATSITVSNLDGSGGVRLQRPARALIVGRVNE